MVDYGDWAEPVVAQCHAGAVTLSGAWLGAEPWEAGQGDGGATAQRTETTTHSAQQPVEVAGVSTCRCLTGDSFFICGLVQSVRSSLL